MYVSVCVCVRACACVCGYVRAYVCVCVCVCELARFFVSSTVSGRSPCQKFLYQFCPRSYALVADSLVSIQSVILFDKNSVNSRKSTGRDKHKRPPNILIMPKAADNKTL